jgi:hypothetical protein
MMAIGDMFAEFKTSGQVRQPSSGVEEKVTSVSFQTAAEVPSIYDGSNSLAVYTSSTTTGGLNSEVASTNQAAYNLGWMINNAVYFKSTAGSARLAITGVQTNA